MADALELLQPLRRGLVPVPAVGQPGICRICHSACDPSYQQCFPCLEAVRALGAPEILPISMSVDRDLLHHHLRSYKDDRSPDARERMGLRLAGLVSVFLHHHSQCLGAFDSVVPVPSPTRTALADVLTRISSVRPVYSPALAAAPGVSKSALDPDRFVLTRDVRGERALLVDDTFTRGPTMFSAVARLEQGGATVIGPLVVGRHINPAWGPSRDLLGWLQERAWDETRCCRCEGEKEHPDRLL